MAPYNRTSQIQPQFFKSTLLPFLPCSLNIPGSHYYTGLVSLYITSCYCLYTILGNLQKKYFGAWRMSKGKGAASEDEKTKEKSPEKTTEESEDEEVCVSVCLCACMYCTRSVNAFAFACMCIHLHSCMRSHFHRTPSGRWASNVPCSLLLGWGWSRYSLIQWWMLSLPSLINHTKKLATTTWDHTFPLDVSRLVHFKH